jgi:sarcosine oxidase subunit gamma
MSEPALASRLPPGVDQVFSGPSASVSIEPAAARFILRGDARAAARIAAIYGPTPPDRPMASAVTGERAAFWLGPDEWLLLAPGEEPAILGRALQSALDGVPSSLVDISQRQIGLKLTGRLAALLLNSGCPLDLAPGDFPPGTVVRTQFHKAEIILWRKEPDTFHLEVWRSFVDYVLGHLDQARRGAADLVA